MDMLVKNTKKGGSIGDVIKQGIVARFQLQDESVNLSIDSKYI
jgi:hypothetical protein